MIHKLPIVSKLLGIDESDVISLIRETGKLFYNIEQEEFNVYLSPFDLVINMGDDETELLSRLLDKSHFNLMIKDNLVIISGNDSFPSAILISPFLDSAVSELIDITDAIDVMIIKDREAQMFIGNTKAIARLSEDFLQPHKIFSLSKFIGENK